MVGICSLQYIGGELSLSFGEGSSTLSAVHITFAAIIVTWAYLISVPLFLVTAGAMLIACTCYVFKAWLRDVLQWLGEETVDLLPKTSFAWGIAAITAAFLLLGIGSLLSLRRTAPREVIDAP